MKNFILVIAINTLVATAAIASQFGTPTPHPEINCKILVC